MGFFSREVLELEEGETVNGFMVKSGWLVDQMTFTTSKGRQVGPFGHSRGGDRTEVVIPKERNIEFTEGTSGRTCLALHGFSFSLVRTLHCPSWFNVVFVYSSVPASLDIKGLQI